MFGEIARFKNGYARKQVYVIDYKKDLERGFTQRKQTIIIYQNQEARNNLSSAVLLYKQKITLLNLKNLIFTIDLTAK